VYSGQTKGQEESTENKNWIFFYEML
jgi:hypothetical protein